MKIKMLIVVTSVLGITILAFLLEKHRPIVMETSDAAGSPQDSAPGQPRKDSGRVIAAISHLSRIDELPDLIFAAGTFGATSNSVVALLVRYSLPSDPEVIQSCINAVRQMNGRKLYWNRSMKKWGDEMDDVRIDPALSEEVRKDKMTDIGYSISGDKAMLAAELKQWREIYVDKLNTMISGLNPSFFDDLYSSVPPPKEHIERQ
jgi:hypothetical protein